MEEYKREFSLKDLEEAIKEVGLPEYPKYLGNGLWKLSEGCITGQRGYELYMEKLKKQVKKDNERILNDPSMVKVVDINGMTISFFPNFSEQQNTKEDDKD